MRTSKTANRHDKEKKKPSSMFSNMLSLRRQIPIVILSILMFFIATLYIVPSQIDPIEYETPDLVKLVGPLRRNLRLQNAKPIHVNEMKAPRSLVQANGLVYTGTHDGKIVAFNDSMVKLITTMSDADCGTLSKCGRPLGLRYDAEQSLLLITDAYKGIMTHPLTDAGVTTGKSDALRRVFPFTDDDVAAYTFLNDVDIVGAGVYVVTQSSTKYPYHKFLNMILEGQASGRVLLVNTNDKTVKVLADHLAYPNGVQLTPDKKYALVVESGRNRVLKIKLDGSKVGLFSDQIPGMPDTIRPALKGGYWVTMLYISHDESPGILHRLRRYPTLRWIMHKFLSAPLMHAKLFPKNSILLRLTEDGFVAESLHSAEEANINISQVLQLPNGTMYFGSYFTSGVRKLENPDMEL